MSESSEQEAVIRWAGYMAGRYPELELLYHIPNGGSRNAIEAANLKRQGVKAGVPDICLPVKRGHYNGLYIEMKFGRNKPTAKQTEWIHKLRECGYKAVVCYGFQDTVKVITEYLEMDKV